MLKYVRSKVEQKVSSLLDSIESLECYVHNPVGNDCQAFLYIYCLTVKSNIRDKSNYLSLQGVFQKKLINLKMHSLARKQDTLTNYSLLERRNLNLEIVTKFVS